MAKVRPRGGYLYLDYRDESRKRHREALGLKDTRENKKIAELELKKIVYELASGVYKEKLKREKTQNITLKQGFEEFKKLKKKNRKTTLIHYKNTFDTIKCFEDRPIRSITVEMIENVETNMLAKGCSKNTIASYFSKLKMMFDYFQKVQYISYNPIPKRKK